MSRHAITWLFAWIIVLASPLQGSAGDGTPDTILVIANKAVKTNSVSRDELRPIFQTKTTTWSDGSPARPFNLPDSDLTRHGFDAAVLGLDPDRVARYWIDRKIRGGERPPKTAPSAAIMVKVIGKSPGAVGYVDSAVALDASVKVVAKIVGGEVVKP